tara:strand:+ start:6928 stop:7119 length:192 start_codon:yes stop_codon:yes gene_type:complete
MAAGLITFALTSTSPQWDKLNKEGWIYRTPTQAKHLTKTTHCYQWLPLEKKAIQPVSQSKKKK